MSCANLVGGCFAGDRAPFAGSQSDLERAVAYLDCCIKSGLTWDAVELELRSYLATRGSSEHYQQFVEEQIQRAQTMFLPWLDSVDPSDSNVTELRR